MPMLCTVIEMRTGFLKMCINVLHIPTGKHAWMTTYYSSMFSMCSISFEETLYAMNVSALWLSILCSWVHIFLVYGGLQCFGTVFSSSWLTLFHYSKACDLHVPYGQDYIVLMERYFLCKVVLTFTDTYPKCSDITLD